MRPQKYKVFLGSRAGVLKSLLPIEKNLETRIDIEGYTFKYTQANDNLVVTTRQVQKDLDLRNQPNLAGILK